MVCNNPAINILNYCSGYSGKPDKAKGNGFPQRELKNQEGRFPSYNF